MKKTIFIIFLFLIPIANALPDLVINPSSIDIQTYEGENKTYNITLYNYGDKDIINLTFSNLVDFDFPLVELIEKANISEGLNASNHTVNITTPSLLSYDFHIRTNETFNQEFISTASFLYTDYLDVEKQTYNITVNNNGFNPSFLTIRQDDDVIVKNTGEEIHRFKTIDGLISYTLNAGESATFNFPDIKLISYYDDETGYAGKINVTNKTILSYIHNTDLDKTLSLSVNSKPRLATIDFDIFLKNIEMGYSDTIVNVINLVNTENITALSINLTANWTKFSENNFDLEGNKNKIVEFNITPINITKPEQTGRTYSIEITVDGINFEPIKKAIDITIKYNNFTSSTIYQNVTTFVWLDQQHLEQFCNENPELCPASNITIEKVVEKWNNVSVSGKDFTDMKGVVDEWARWSTEREASFDDAIGSVKGDVQDLGFRFDEVKVKFENLSTTVANTSSKQEEKIENIKKDMGSIKGLIALVITLFLIIIMLIAGHYFKIPTLLKKRKRVWRY